MPDFKTPLLWLLGVLLVAALGLVGVERTQVLKARADTSEAKRALTAEKLDRATVNEARSRAAFRYMEQVAADQLAHATTQQEISNALALQTAARVDADHRYAALDLRMRGTAEALRAALDRADSEARGPASEHPGDRPDTLNAAFADGGQLLARSGTLVASCRNVVAQRDSEVAALKAVIDNDRRLFDGALSLGLGSDKPTKLKNWSE